MRDFTRNTKIVMTFGPTVSSTILLTKAFLTGADVVRLNFSHGTQELHAKSIGMIRSISEKYRLPIAILLDLQGPKIRTGLLEEGKNVVLKKGNRIKIVTKDIKGSEDVISTSYKALPKDIKRGNRILIDDGLMELKVLKIEKGEVICSIITGGILSEHKGMNFPDTIIKLPSLTAKDKRDLEFGLKQDIDYISLSFVHQAKDIVNLKRYMKRLGYSIPVIAKIETPQAVKNIDEILDKAEGVMVARGDLGVEMSPQMVPIAQKMIVKKANQKSRLVIIATQMLDSMIRNPSPTRAEVSDVANAIFDGTDAIMLSGETAMGKYPIAAIKMMSDVAYIAEENSKDSSYLKLRNPSACQDTSPGKAIAPSACYVAKRVGAKAIIVYTLSGSTALDISKERPKERIIAFTPNKNVYRQMSLYWNVTPLMTEMGEDTAQMIREGQKVILKNKILKMGDCVIIVAGMCYVRGATNMIKIHHIGDD